MIDTAALKTRLSKHTTKERVVQELKEIGAEACLEIAKKITERGASEREEILEIIQEVDFGWRDMVDGLTVNVPTKELIRHIFSSAVNMAYGVDLNEEDTMFPCMG